MTKPTKKPKKPAEKNVVVKKLAAKQKRTKPTSLDNKLTAKQEAFAQAVASGLNQSDAYRKAFNPKKNIKLDTVNQMASRVMANIKVASRVVELRRPAVEEVGLTLAQHLRDLKALRDKADASEKYGPAVAAEVSRGRAAGLYVEKVEHSGSVTINMDSTDERA